LEFISNESEQIEQSSSKSTAQDLNFTLKQAWNRLTEFLSQKNHDKQ
jgi:hypothetical protein